MSLNYLSKKGFDGIFLLETLFFSTERHYFSKSNISGLFCLVTGSTCASETVSGTNLYIYICIYNIYETFCGASVYSFYYQIYKRKCSRDSFLLSAIFKDKLPKYSRILPNDNLSKENFPR